MNSKEKSKFRATAKWKKFRAWMRKEHPTDAITEKPLLSGWNLHHMDLDENNYTDLSHPDHFACLNKTSHKFIHWLYRYKNWRDVLNNIYGILEKMEQLNKK